MLTEKYFKVANIVVDYFGARVGANGLAVYMVLCRYMDNEDGTCFPSLRRIEEKTHLTRPTVLKALEKLEEVGLIVKENRQHSENKRNISNRYHLVSTEEWLEQKKWPGAYDGYSKAA